ncbi:MAG: Gfo/Idh/MocA family oxidoreductase [Armatimonadota bacterium]|nr:Gfo/Idh/MocA family oxidoreductase [Armatimonadota bacterium]
MTKVRFGLVGCGVIHGWHTEVLNNLKDEAELVAVCDVVPERAQASADKWGVEAYTSLKKMLRRKDIDAIAIGTPSGRHADQAMEAIKAGKHVLIEKPIDVSLKKADALVKAARKAGVVLTPISQNRYGAGVRKLHEWLHEGKLGRLVYGEATTIWHRTQDYYDSGDWRGTWALDGGGALMNQGVHYADQLRWALGAPKSVSARAATLGHDRIEVEDIVTASIEFESGAIGTLTATTCAFPGFATTLDIYGTSGTVKIANNELVLAKFTNGETYTAADAAKPAAGAGDPSAISHHGHTNQFRDFIAAIREGRDPWITGEMGRDALELVIGVYKSAYSGKTVNFPLPTNTGRGK